MKLPHAVNLIGAVEVAAEMHAAGVRAGKEGRAGEAVSLLTRAAELKPRDAEVLNDLGVAREQAGDWAGAEQAYRSALHQRPGFAPVWANLANVLLHCGDPAGAEQACRRSISLMPRYAPAHNTLGAALVDQGRADEALAEYRRAIELNPGSAPAHANYGMALLLCEDFENGWREYEWRRKFTKPPCELPGKEWDGSDPFGRTLLLHGEGGIGNVIQFLRYVPAVRDLGVRVVVQCQEELVPLAKSVDGAWKVISYKERAPEADGHVPLASLPSVLKGFKASLRQAQTLSGNGCATEDTAGLRQAHTLTGGGCATSYLKAEPGRVERWGRVLNECRLKAHTTIGVCWRGSQSVVQLRGRSFEPGELRPIANVPGVTLVNLQHGEAPPDDLPVVTLPGLEPKEMRLEDVAAVMHHLDLVITCDTSIAHLAGALGVKTWVALKHAACWRWMRGREDSPWYPSLRLFRQEDPGAWGPVFEKMAEELK